MAVARILRNSIRRIRRDGLTATVRAFLRNLRPTLFYVYRSLEPPPSFAEPAPVIIRRGLASLREARTRGVLLPDEFYHDNKPGFRDCFVAWCDGMPAGIQWLIAGPARTSHMILGEGQAELCGLYVLHRYRGRGVARLLAASACRAARSEGCPELYTVIERSNIASQRCLQSLGFRRIGTWRRVAGVGPLYRSTALAGPNTRHRLIVSLARMLQGALLRMRHDGLRCAVRALWKPASRRTLAPDRTDRPQNLDVAAETDVHAGIGDAKAVARERLHARASD